MLQKLKTIIVTGSNKGIGYAIVDNLAGKPDWNIIMACRNMNLANQSLSKLLRKHPSAQISVRQLDVSQEASICSFVETLKKENQQVDVLVNNAGMAWKGNILNQEVVETTFATNFYGTIFLTESMIDLIRQKGKIITLGSAFGKFKWLSSYELEQRFKDPNLSKQDLYKIMIEYEKAVADYSYIDKGYPISAYMMSKLGINIYATKILPKLDSIIRKQIQVYCQCPGYVSTDMTDHKGFLPVEKGALTTVYLAELPFEVNPQFQGKFFQKCKVSKL